MTEQAEGSRRQPCQALSYAPIWRGICCTPWKEILTPPGASARHSQMHRERSQLEGEDRTAEEERREGRRVSKLFPSDTAELQPRQFGNRQVDFAARHIFTFHTTSQSSLLGTSLAMCRGSTWCFGKCAWKSSNWRSIAQRSLNSLPRKRLDSSLALRPFPSKKMSTLPG